MIMERITSFQVDHNKIVPGMYVSRIDGDITTFDLRVKKPNAGDYMSHLEMHTTEHMVATFIRNSEIGQNIIYFGPMGCRTGFYFTLFGELDEEAVAKHLLNVLEKVAVWDKPIPATTEPECGNYRDHDLEGAKHFAKQWCDGIKKKGWVCLYIV